ncbi:MAG TPA: PIN domain-containing protein [bacterium]|nr:PIN domain-containing protein [bacterium]
MLKPKIYLDTTIPSAYLDDRAPDRQRLTKAFWERRIKDYDPVISEIVIKEIRDTRDPGKRERMENLVVNFTVLEFGDEARDLAREYVNYGVFTERNIADANHAAIAVANGIGYIISWNFQHLVRIKTRREINLVNSLRGFGPVEIVSPPEL